MSFCAHKEVYKKHTIKIIADDSPESPREWDNMGHMVCVHRRYNLGDEQLSDAYSGWDEIDTMLRRDRNAAVVLPLYLFDHSGITISTSSFSCPWDSGRVGAIYVTREKLQKEYGVKRLTKKIIAKAQEVLEAEVEAYDQYLRGDVYGYQIYEKNNDEDDVEASWNFYGQEYCLEEARATVDAHVREEEKERAARSLYHSV